MTDTLEITSSKVKKEVDVTVFHLDGTLDAANEEALCEKARQAFEGGVKFLVLDMEKLEFISSAGLRALHKIANMCMTKAEIDEARKSGGTYKTPHFKLAGAPSNVYYVLNLAGFLHTIPFYPSVEAALESFAA